MRVGFQDSSTLAARARHLGAVDIRRAGCVAARVEEVDANVRLGVDGLDLSAGVGGQRHPTVLLAGEVELFAAGREALLALAAACLETGYIDICRLDCGLDDGCGLGLGCLGSLGCRLGLVGGILPLGGLDPAWRFGLVLAALGTASSPLLGLVAQQYFCDLAG